MKRLIFKVNNLEKKYGSISALDLKKLDIHPGTIYGIVGNVGSGKSTLLNILAGAEKESSGTVLYEDDTCLLYTSPSPRDRQKSRMPSSA